MNFRWDQCGQYDVPAMVSYVRNVTGRDKIQFVGFSMGATGFIAAMNEHPDMSDKVKAAHLLAPVAYVGHLRGPSTLLRPFIDINEVQCMLGMSSAKMSPSTIPFQYFLEKVGYDEFAPASFSNFLIGRW